LGARWGQLWAGKSFNQSAGRELERQMNAREKKRLKIQPSKGKRSESKRKINVPKTTKLHAGKKP